MDETLKMMKSVLTGKEKGKDEKELIIEYQEKWLPNILAYFYCENIGIIKRIVKLYPILDDEDYASFCLQELDKCLLNYDLESNAKFITYFITCFKNRLRMETEQLLTQKRKSILNYSDITELNIESNKSIDDNIDLELENYNLTNDEKKHCKLAYEGYTMLDIAKRFNTYISKIQYQRNAIKLKILKEF